MAIGAVSSLPTLAHRETSPGAARQAEFKGHAERAMAARPKFVPSVRKPDRTPLSGEQAASAISRAYEELTGEAPSKGTLAILTSHWSLETGRGANMYNYNFAGLKGVSPEGQTTRLRTREGYGDHEVHIRDGFRAYSSAAAGAKDYVSLLVRRYGPALDAARAEDPGAFASKLKQGGYYTGNEALYAKGITRLANQAMDQGLNAIGGTAGAVTGSSPAEKGYFAEPTFAGVDALAQMSSIGEFSASPLSDFSLMAWDSANASSLTEEITRAALAIALEETNRRNDNDRGDEKHRG